MFSRRKAWVYLFRGAMLLGITGLAAVTRFGTKWPSVYFMTGPSMEPTLAAEEYFLVWQPASPLKRGELVLFRFEDEDGEFHVLRRLAALAGDTIAMRHGEIWLNGERKPWKYHISNPRADRSAFALVDDLYDWGPWIVPPDSVVLLSDTRGMLGWPDSRFIGYIPVSDLLGRATRTLRGRRLR